MLTYFGIRSTSFIAAARERSRSCCQKCRWQVTAKTTCILLTILFYVYRPEVDYYIRDVDGGWVRGGGEVDERVKARLDHGYRPKKTGETVDRPQNNGSAQ